MSKRTTNKRTKRSTQRTTSRARQTGQPVQKVRGGWLTAVLVYIILDGLLGAALLIAFRRSDGPPLPVLITLAAFAALASIVAGVAMWYWKRWGLYLYVAATAATIAVGLVVLPSLITAFHGIIPLGILGLILSNQNKLRFLE